MTIRSEKGQAQVEFALVALLFFIVVFGIFEIGRLFLQYTAVANAAQEAARYASIHGNGCTTAAGTACAAISQSDIEAYAINHAAISGVTATADWPASPDPGTTVSVTVNSEFTPIIPFVADAMGSSLTVSNTASMIISQ